MACAGLSLLILFAACNGAVQPDAMTLQNVHEDHLQLSQKEKHCPNPMFVRQSTQNKKLLNKAQYNTSLSVQQTLREPRE